MGKIVVDNDLATDVNGAIKVYDSDDILGKKEMVELWLNTESNTIPLIGYGNNIRTWIFESMIDSAIESRIDQLIDFISSNFGLEIVDEYYEFDKDLKTIKLDITLKNNLSLSLDL